MTNIYVGNLPYSTEEDELVQHFSRWGQVERATLVFDRETGRPRGFGFVEMVEPEAAQKAIEEAHGESFQGRPLTVNEARPRGSGSRGSNLSVSSQGTSGGYSAPTVETGGSGYSNNSPAPTPPRRASEDAPKPSGGGGYSNYLYS
ncbi:MAG: RNA-binding protein [Planctomycetota bacterium]